MPQRYDIPDGSRPPIAFVATLGLFPQVITRSLDWLPAHGITPERAVIIHTSAWRPHRDWPTFDAFRNYLRQRYPGIRFEFVSIEDEDGALLDDVNTPHDTEVAFRIIYNVTRKLKRENYRLHSLISGGRKSIIIYTVLSAQLLYDADDRLWHIFSEDEYHHELGLRPHVPDGIVELSEIPVLYVSRVAPIIRELILHSDDPTRAVRIFEEQEDVEKLAQLQRFFDECEEEDRRILLLRYRGEPNRRVAALVHMSESAVSNRLKAVAERYYRDPRLGRSRYAELPNNLQGAILVELRPVLSRIVESSR